MIPACWIGAGACAFLDILEPAEATPRRILTGILGAAITAALSIVMTTIHHSEFES